MVAYRDGDVPSRVLDVEGRNEILASLRTLGEPSPNTTHRIVSRAKEHRQIIVVGLPDRPSTAALREAAGIGVRAAGEMAEVAVDMPHANANELEAIAEGSGLGAYRFTAYKSGNHPVTNVSVVTEIDAGPLERAGELLEAQKIVRDLVNTPGADLGPSAFVHRVRSLVEGTGIEVAVFEEGDLRAEGCGGLLGVGRGSDEAPVCSVSTGIRKEPTST